MPRDPPLIRVSRRGRITVPVAVRRAAGIEEGDLVTVTIERDSIVLTPKQLVDKSQAYFFSESWQKGEREADQDIVEGRLSEYDDVESLLLSLRERKV